MLSRLGSCFSVYETLLLLLITTPLSLLLGQKLGVDVAAADGNYSVALANRMCEFALSSYCCGNLGHGVGTWSCQACQLQPQITNVTVFSSEFHKDANGFVAYDPSIPCIVVAFAGTDPLSIEDWLDDLDAVKVPYPACASQGCEVHQGFYETYLAVSNYVWDAVEKYWAAYGADTPLQITGHSLGAALAAHCAIDFYDQKQIQPMFVYTYGQPRVGNKAFADYYNGCIHIHYRVTHRKDPVPHVPSEERGFYHMMEEVFYPKNPNETYMLCTESGEQPNCSDQYLLDLDINDHLDYMGFNFVNNFMSCKL